MKPSIKKAQELMKLGSIQMEKGVGIESLNDYINEAYQVTGDKSLLDLSPPENAVGIGQKAYVAYEKQAIVSVIHSLNTFLVNPRNIAKAGRNISEMEKEKERKEKERKEWEKEQRERAEARKKEKEEEEKPKEEEKEKEKVQKETSEEETPEYYQAFGLKKGATQEEIQEAYHDAMNDPSRSKEEKAELGKKYFILADEELRGRYNEDEAIKSEKRAQKKAEDARQAAEKAAIQKGIAEPSEKDASWKLIIAFNPRLTENSDDWTDMKDQMEQAKRVTSTFKEYIKNAGFVEYGKEQIEKLKRIGAIPKQFSDEEANSVLNTASWVLASGGTAKELLSAVEKSKDIDPKQKGFFESVVLNVALIQASNPTLSKNLTTAAGNPEINIQQSSSANLGDNFKQIALDFSNNVLVPALDKVKSYVGDRAKVEVKKFIAKSLETKAAKQVIKMAAKIGLKATLQTIAQAVGSALPGIGNAVLGFLAWIAGELLEKIFSKVKDFIEKNKDAFIGGGLVLLGIGAATGNTLLIGAGSGLIVLPFMAGGVALVAAGATGAAAFTAAFLVAVFPVAAIAIGIFIGIAVLILLTIIILFVINSGGYVLPALFEQGATGVTPPDCIGSPPPIPDAGTVLNSPDGDYAFPVGQYKMPGYSYYHWDGNKAADIFSPDQRPPILAQENGNIVNVTLNDSLGGKYIILQGTTSGRFYYYAHLCHIFVNRGASVSVGQVIATMDETGSGRVQHLHYAINENSDVFIGGDGDICPQSDFEEKFDFGICTDSLTVSLLTGKPRCCVN